MKMIRPGFMELLVSLIALEFIEMLPNYCTALQVDPGTFGH